jgi:uncharacterized protein YodC (DUF2158 family)
MDNFKAGDTVELKSGGPIMTISKIETRSDGNRALCQWFDERGEAKQAYYPLTSLKPSTEQPPRVR